MKPVLLAAILGVLLVALIVWASLGGRRRYRVEVCMTFGTQSACKKVSAKTEAAALRAATENACADIASGVTDSIKCAQSNPTKVTWLARAAAEP